MVTVIISWWNGKSVIVFLIIVIPKWNAPVVSTKLQQNIVSISPSGVTLVLPPPPSIVTLLQYQDSGAFGEGQLVGLLRLVVVFDNGGAQRLGGLDPPGAGRLGTPAPTTHRRAVRRQRLGT